MESWYSRLMEATNCSSQIDLADFLGIRQSSISDAKRRGIIPADWLIKLLSLRGINPEWIQNGTEPKVLVPCTDTTDLNLSSTTFTPAFDRDAELLVCKLLRCFPTQDLLTELQRRKESADKKGEA